MAYKMEAVRAPLGHMKERQVKWDLTALRPCIMMALKLEHFSVADFVEIFVHLRQQITVCYWPSWRLAMAYNKM